MKQPRHMKTRTNGKILVTLALIFVLGGATTQVRSEVDKFPLITIHGTEEAVVRGKTGSLVLSMNPIIFGERWVNFSVKGTAVPGVDYMPLISPAHVGKSGYGVIQVQTLLNPRGPAALLSYSVVVTLEPGPGYVVGEPRSAQLMISP